MRETHEYDYSRMLVMLGDPPDWVPLAVCVSWATLVFIAMKTTDLLALPWSSRPWVDGLIAVCFDLVADPVASNSRFVSSLEANCATADGPATGGLGVWQWCVLAGEPTWMGVPFANYIFWFLVVFLISFGIRWGQHRWGAADTNPGRQVTMLLVIGVVAAAGVMACLQTYNALLDDRPVAAGLVLIGILAVPVGLLIRSGPRLERGHPLDKGLLMMPVISQTGSLVYFFWFGFDRDRPLWAMLILLATAASLTLFALPYSRWRSRRSTADVT
jgi:hypothetical protein